MCHINIIILNKVINLNNNATNSYGYLVFKSKNKQALHK